VDSKEKSKAFFEIFYEILDEDVHDYEGWPLNCSSSSSISSGIRTFQQRVSL
jgi:hypothetical protein